jgi:predicted kinase
MRRFEEEATLDRIAERQELSADLIIRLVGVILRSHQRAAPRGGRAATAALERYLDQNEAAFAVEPGLFDPARARDLTRGSRAALSETKALLIARGEKGYVRRCHGDLHLRNIALIHGEPTLFNAVEFDDEIAAGDVLYDLAFLLMDLEERRLRPAANLLLNRYLWGSDEAHLTGLAALPIFLSIRSALRAKVIAAGLSHLNGEARARAAAEARRYFWYAEEFLKQEEPRLVAVGGLSGAGKSALAGQIAPLLDRAPGAIWLRSDVERKRLLGVGEADHLPQEAYSEAAARDVYTQLCRKAALTLKSGQSVIVDAVHSKAEERRAVERVATELGFAFTGLWLEAPVRTRLERVADRKNDASDADVAIARAQTVQEPSNLAWHRLDSSGDLPAITQAACHILELPKSRAQRPPK